MGTHIHNKILHKYTYVRIICTSINVLINAIENAENSLICLYVPHTL